MNRRRSSRNCCRKFKLLKTWLTAMKSWYELMLDDFLIIVTIGSIYPSKHDMYTKISTEGTLRVN